MERIVGLQTHALHAGDDFVGILRVGKQRLQHIALSLHQLSPALVGERLIVLNQLLDSVGERLPAVRAELRRHFAEEQLENPVQRPRLEKDHHQSDDHRGQRAEHEQQNKAGAQRGGGVLRR